MHSRFTPVALLVVVLALAATLTPVATAQPDGKPSKEELVRIYREVVQDPTFQSLKAQLRGNLKNQRVVDQYLTWLPISPLHLLEADMYQNRFEIAVPRIIYEWHLRWQELHGQRMDRKSQGTEDDSAVSGPPEAATVGTNRNSASLASPAPLDYQGEIQVVVNPNNTQQIVSAANTWDDINGTCGDFGLQAVFYSADGGVTWGYSCPPDHGAYPGVNCGALGGATFGSDPALYWDDNGNVFLNYMLICYLGGDDYRYAMVAAKSADGGATWSANGVIKDSYASGDLEDKNFYIIDNNPGSPYYGRHYTCWDRNNDEKLARSTNGGVDWTEADLPTTSGQCGGGRFRYDLGCEMAVEDNGTVHVIYDTLACNFQTCKCEQMYYSRSTDGGASWSSAQQIGNFNLVGFSNDNTPDVQDERGIGPFGAIDVDNTGGACDGNLYVTYADHTGGGASTADIFMIRSTNGGSSWSAPLKVNDDNTSNTQFHPFLVVDQSTGDVVVAWHDARNDPGNDAVDYYVARSTDCGQSFEANVQVSQPSSEFNNSGISFSNENSIDNPGNNPNQYGEYMGLDAQGGKAYLAWADTRHFFPSFTGEAQKENVGFAVVDFGPPCPDADGDTYTDAACGGLDCDDTNAAVNPGASEVDPGGPLCSDTLDNDCDGLTDGADPDCQVCQDNDGDGYGNPGSAACPNGAATDCNDNNAAINPGANENCTNGIDDDCDSLIDAADPECQACTPQGGSCSSSSECCPGLKCKGGPGGKTCKP